MKYTLEEKVKAEATFSHLINCMCLNRYGSLYVPQTIEFKETESLGFWGRPKGVAYELTKITYDTFYYDTLSIRRCKWTDDELSYNILEILKGDRDRFVKMKSMLPHFGFEITSLK